MLKNKSLSGRGIDFEKLSRQGKSVKEGLLILKKIGSDFKETRFAVSVSKKVSKKATTRNKIKRRIKNILDKRILKEKISGEDFMVIVLPGAEKEKFAELEKTVNNLLLRAKITKNV